ncbi:MAG TPA: N-formylglutamate amidohydrolase [Chryseolinea sp.]|nr:N-formylglutamate amidohydrolase [Chryseolinea sp.]
MKPFNVHSPIGRRIPILLSVPHCGVKIPDELAASIKDEMLETRDDADWFVDKLYDFAPSLGMTMITSNFHRWVIDLNRDPEDKPLYADGRIITGLCPVTDFLGELLYKDKRQSIDADEIMERRRLYYDPYHQQLIALLSEIKDEFGKVILWECHSIRQYVRTIYRDKFPDLILGDAEGAAASPVLIEAAFSCLQSSHYSVSHNFPFSGGYITRTYGRPLENQHALQLEMTKINYMDDTEVRYDESRAEKMGRLLSDTLTSLAESLIAKV